MTIKMLLAAAAMLALLGTGVTHAQTPTPAPSKTTQASKDKPRTAKSLECSKQADEKGLHGKPRKKFMSTCKKA
jgi:hypothetical protein